MPAQLSTVLYISEYIEKTSGEFFVGTAIGHTRLDEDGDGVQMFNITVFYPFDEDKVCYVPRLESNQVLSIANSKFCRGQENKIDLILTAATILEIKPEDLPVHPIYVSGTASVTDGPTITEVGTQFPCLVNDYLSKNKSVETPITFFHPISSRLSNQTSTVKRGSSVFFSGVLSSVDGEFYLELHNFSFISKTHSISQTKGAHSLPWSNNSSTESSSSKSSLLQTIHKQSRSQQQSPPTKTSKRKSNTPKFNPNKNQKLADIATNAINPSIQSDLADTETQELPNNQQS